MAAANPLKLVDLGSGQGAIKEFEAGDQLAAALNGAAIVSLAAAATTNIGAAAANVITVTGTTGITAFDSAPSGSERTLVFAGVVTLTHNGTSLILPKAANVTTAAGDVLRFVSLGGGNWRCTGKMLANDSATWGLIAGTLSAQTDLQAALDTKGVFGVGQSWQTMTGSRALGTTYTNSTGKPILINVGASSSVGALMTINIGGLSFNSTGQGSAGFNISTGNVLVPPGSTYAVSVNTGTPSGLSWMEFR